MNSENMGINHIFFIYITHSFDMAEHILPYHMNEWESMDLKEFREYGYKQYSFIYITHSFDMAEWILPFHMNEWANMNLNKAFWHIMWYK